jgi:hypothetical protein
MPNDDSDCRASAPPRRDQNCPSREPTIWVAENGFEPLIRRKRIHPLFWPEVLSPTTSRGVSPPLISSGLRGQSPPGMVKRREDGQFGTFQSPSYRQSPARTDHKKRPRASGRCRSAGNAPVTLRCVPDAVLAARARTVTGGLISTARLVTWGPVRKTTSGVLHTVSPSQSPPRVFL